MVPEKKEAGAGWAVGLLSTAVCLPSLTWSSGQKYMTKVVKLFGPLSRNYYVRAFLHLG